MSDTHAGPILERRVGQCRWTWHWEDVDLACHDRAIPGGNLCADHLIQAAHAREQAERDAQRAGRFAERPVSATAARTVVAR